MSTSSKPVKVACVTCYFDPEYIRSRTIRAGLAASEIVTPIIIKNRSRGAKRYIEVARAMVRCRFHDKPDVWLLNFRGYELLPLTLLLAGRKPVIYDEFINPVLVVEEHRSLKTGIVRRLMGLWRIFGWFYYLFLRRCAVVLTDTPAHARYAAKLAGVNSKRYRSLPVGTDETLFTPPAKPLRRGKVFDVFFYGTGTQPLHGVDTIIQAAQLLQEDRFIRFTLAGTKGGLADKVAAAKVHGANIWHEPWIPFEQLPEYMRKAGVCLGGPFGGTQQADLVITGKTFQMLACGAPVIVGSSPATNPDFIDRFNSLVVPQADAVSLAAAIRWAATHPDRLAEIAQRGQKLYEATFSQRIINYELDRIVRSVVQR